MTRRGYLFSSCQNSRQIDYWLNSDELKLFPIAFAGDLLK